MDVPLAVYVILTSIGVAWLFVLYTIVRKFYSDWQEMREEQAEALEARRLAKFTPEPLVNEWPRHQIDRLQLSIVEPNGADFIRADFLSLARHPDVTQAACAAVRRYGVGSCSPPAFFGSSTPHLEAVELLQRVYQADAGLLYAWGAMTVASVTAAYVEKPDTVLLHTDTALDLIDHLEKTCQCKVVMFRDTEHLQSHLDKWKRGTSLPTGRLFFFLEGLYASTGRICDLPKILEFAQTYRARIILDETYSFGVIGKDGGGVLKYYDIPPADVDVICGSLEPVWGVVGGFSVGTPDAIDVQQLASKAYIYTAALPAFLAQAFLAAYAARQERQRKLEELAAEFDVLLMGLPELGNISTKVSPRKVLAIEDEKLRLEAFKVCRDVHKVYLDRNDCGIVINLYYDLAFVDKGKKKKLEDALIDAARVLREL